jgi:RNA recognition motif-containing protein
MDDTVESNKLYIGNLPFKTTEEDLRAKFEKFDVEDGELLQRPRGQT